MVFNKIKNEINTTYSIAIMTDEMPDCSKKSQLTTIVRYVDESSIVQERCLGFSDVSVDLFARALSGNVIEVVKRVRMQFEYRLSFVRQGFCYVLSVACYSVASQSSFFVCNNL